ncbi:MAG: TetR/AcrR family transcriptional regulator [Burkholderiaceae bacterium]
MNQTPSRARQRLSPEMRRQQILDSAIACFAEHGFGVRTRELTKRIGVSQPLLYRYFPSKDAVIEAVIEAVFLGPLRTDWAAELGNRDLPLAQRLQTFYQRYAEATYRPEWIRLYMYAGLANMPLNRDYLALVRDQLLQPMCQEFYHAFIGIPRTEPAGPREIELAWTLHGSMFYWAVRRNIFQFNPQVSFAQRSDDAIHLFLHGARDIYPTLVEPALASSHRPRQNNNGSPSATR